MVLFREHRSSLSESMETVKEIESLDDIYNSTDFKKYEIVNDLRIDPYCYDSRINWDTYIVTSPDYGIVGFTNGPIQEKKA